VLLDQKVKAALKKLDEEEKRAEMLLRTDERKRPYNSMTETKVQSSVILRFLFKKLKWRFYIPAAAISF
jgi:hypothetical protein